jgi:hypothetical protein
MLSIGIDWSDAQRVMSNLQAAEDQMPFAMALALNAATEKTRKHLITETWGAAHGIKVRNQSFIAASLTTKGTRATKRQLETEIYDRLQRGHLMMHAKGGQRVPQGRAHMAVPVSSVQRTGRGVPQNLRPKAMGTKLFPLKGGSPDRLYTRDKRSGKLKLMYVLKTRTRIPKRVPFFEDYRMVMSRELMRALPIAVERAMSTRRVR